MQSYSDRASLEALLHTQPADNVGKLLRERVELYASSGLLDDSHLLVIEPGDTEERVKEATGGLWPALNPIDQARYPSPLFCPWWDHLQRSGQFFEMIICFGSTHALVILVEDAPGVESELLCLCRQYAVEAIGHG